MSYSSKEVIWAKPVGYPWWPAIISKLPDNNNNNFKVLFINQDNYAVMDPKFVRKYDEYYHELSKNKTKKLQNAINKANTMIESKMNADAKNKKKNTRQKKSIQKLKIKNVKVDQLEQQQSEQQQQAASVTRLKKYSSKREDLMVQQNQHQSQDQEQLNQDQLSSENQNQKKKDQSLTPIGSYPFLSEELSLERETQQGIDRQKIQKIEGEVHKIVVQFQMNKIQQWKYANYFAAFDIDYLTCQQLLQSNLTRMIRYIIVRMTQLQFSSNAIAKIEVISQQMKNRIIEYLSNTAYYDKYLRIFDINKQNQAQAEAIISKLIKKQNLLFQNNVNRIKKQNILIFTELIGQQIGKGSSFKTKEFINDLKSKKYDLSTKLTSKAASQRFAEIIVNRYI